MRWIGVLLVIAGCHTGGTVGPDTPGMSGDGAPNGLGMFVTWRASPDLPGPATDKVGVSDVTFRVERLQLVADAGSVTRSKFLLVWEDGAAPMQDQFPDAPPGVYSKVALVLGGGSSEDSYRIRGTWREGMTTKQFEIHDDAPLSVSLDCNETLAAGGSAAVAIKLDLAAAIGGIAFKDLEDDNGTLELHDGSALDAFRGRLQRAFELGN